MYSNLFLSSPMSLGELLDRAFRLYRARFAPLVLIAALFWIPYGIVSGLMTGNVMMGYLDFLQNMMVDPAVDAGDFSWSDIAPITDFAGAMLITSLIGLAVQAIVTLSLVTQGAAAIHGEFPSWRASLRGGWRRFWPYIGMVLLKFFLLMLVALGIYLVLFLCTVVAAVAGGVGLSAFDFDGGQSGAGGIIAAAGIAMIFVCVGLLFFALVVFPVLYLWARWLVSTPGLVVQKWGPVRALRGSWQLTQGQVRRCIVYSILLYILNLIVVSAPAYIIQQIGLALAPPEWMGRAMGASVGISSLFNVLWQPFFVCALVLFYFDLRVRQQGYDLELRIAQMETALGAAPEVDGEPPATDALAPSDAHSE